MEEKPKSQPIMGKNALMIKTNLENDDSHIIKKIVMGKYSPTLQHYIDRLQQRRRRIKTFSESTSTDSSITSTVSSTGFWFPENLSFDSLPPNEPSSIDTKRRSYIRTSPSHITHGHVNYASTPDEENKIATHNCSNTDYDYFTDYVEDNTHDYLEELKKELATRNEIIFQVSKALVHCKKSRSFVHGTEYMEAERILLITSLTKEALIGEINTIEFNNYVKPLRNPTKADLEVSHVEFHPKTPDDSIYLLIAICGRKVIASDMTKMNNDGKLRFEEKFLFEGLTTDFLINFLLYEMPVELDAARIEKGEPVINCNPLKKFFHFSNHPKKQEIQRLKPSAFRLRATSTFSSGSIPKFDTSPTTLRLTELPKPPTLSPECSLTVSNRSIRWETVTEGFLTVGTGDRSSSTVWNRRWCRLDGPAFKYWNYPSEDKAAPLDSVDLRISPEVSIGPAGRDVCARSRTLLLVADRNYLLCADDEAQLEKWRCAVEEVLVALSIWKCK